MESFVTYCDTKILGEALLNDLNIQGNFSIIITKFKIDELSELVYNSNKNYQGERFSSDREIFFEIIRNETNTQIKSCQGYSFNFQEISEKDVVLLFDEEPGGIFDLIKANLNSIFEKIGINYEFSTTEIRNNQRRNKSLNINAINDGLFTESLIKNNEIRKELRRTLNKEGCYIPMTLEEKEEYNQLLTNSLRKDVINKLDIRNKFYIFEKQDFIEKKTNLLVNSGHYATFFRNLNCILNLSEKMIKETMLSKIGDVVSPIFDNIILPKTEDILKERKGQTYFLFLDKINKTSLL